jgi:asparagine N-glycosylation enzyme membrane subunit Stt3
MKNNNNFFLWILWIIGILLIGGFFSLLIILFLKYFPLGEKRNMDLFLIALAIVSVYYIVKWIIKKIKR